MNHLKIDVLVRLCVLKDKIGRVIMTLTRVMIEGEFQDCYELDGAKSGKLCIHLKWTPRLKLRDAS